MAATYKYIDLSATANGSGTSASPYDAANGLAALNAITGNRSDEHWLLKRGTSYRGSILIPEISDAYGFHLGCYGDAEALPLLNGADVWTAGWTLYSGNVWVSATTMATERGWFADDVRLLKVTSIGAMTAFTSYYASNLHYVDLGGLNPNNYVMEYTSRDSGVSTLSSNCTISNLWASKTKRSAFACSIGSVATPAGVLLISGCKGEKAGAWSATTPGSAFSLYGKNKTQPATLYALGNEGNYAHNNLIEFWSLTNSVLRGNFGRYNCNSYEVWGYVTNTELAENKSYDVKILTGSIGHNCGIWITKAAELAGETGNNTNITAHHNEFSFVQNGTSTGIGIHNQGGTGHKFENNSIYNCKQGYSSDTVGSGDITTFTFKNNIVHGAPNSVVNHVMMLDTDTNSTGTFDNNRYYRSDKTQTAASNFSKAGAGNTYIAFSGGANYWQSGGRDTNATYGDPLFTNPANNDFSLQAGSACRDTGATGLGYKRDITGYPIYGTPNRGSREHAIDSPPICSATNN